MNDFTTTDPFALFTQWLAEATKSEPNDPNAMCLATVSTDGMPNARMVLLKDHSSEGGFTFYTNFESTKAQELLATKMAGLLFHWKSLRRQIRVQGTISQVPDETADAYFATRHPQSQLGAWASKQSQPLDSRQVLLDEVHKFAQKYTVEIPRPPNWSGFCLAPTKLEFWQEGEHRLHDRIQFTRQNNQWQKQLLYP